MQSLKKLFSFKGLFAIIVLAISLQIISPEIAFAEQNDTLQGLAELLGVLISVLTFISLLMMNMFGQLLGTNLLTGPEAMQALTPMWVWVRNLTNILFVLVLVGLAFSNLFASFSGEGGGNWTIKEKLPKVIIALVAINFSLLGFKVVIDAVNVGTVAILGIADSRLDADNPEQENAMISDKTWTIVSGNLYGKMDIVKFEEGQNKISGGSSCTSENKEAKLEPGQVLGIIKKDSKNKDRHYICRSFRSQVNDLFCSNWEKITNNDKDYPEQGALDDDCLFLLKKNTFNTMLSPKDEPGQNLFMSFGTTFMHLERLPALGAQINSLNGVIMNTLFSSILGIAYIVALIAIFIALIARVIVIWIALVFSPLLIAASIMGFGEGKAGEATEKLITHLIMPLKIAAAFAVSFVMMSGMVEFNTVGKNDAFLFGPALSNLGIAEYGFLWQMATIAIFWMAAQWATEGNLAHSITEKIFTGAQALGETAARAATIDRQIFSVGTGESGKKFSMSNVMGMPGAIKQAHDSHNLKGRENMLKAFNINQSDYQKSLTNKNFNESGLNLGKDIAATIGGATSLYEANKNMSTFMDRLKLGSADAKKLHTKLTEEGATIENLSKYGKSMGILSEKLAKEILEPDHYKGKAAVADTNPPKTEVKPVNSASVDTGSEGKMYINGKEWDATAIVAGNAPLAGTEWQMKDIVNTLTRAGKTADNQNINELITTIKNKDAKNIEGITLDDNVVVNYSDDKTTTISGGKEGAKFMKIIDEKNHFVKFAGSDEGKITKSNVANTFNTAYNNVFETVNGTVKQKSDASPTAIKELSILQKSISNIQTTLGNLENDKDATAAIQKVKDITITIPPPPTN